jgi:hypothetical protein
MKHRKVLISRSFFIKNIKDTAGLKCALYGPKQVIKKYRPQKVASALANNAIAIFPDAKFSAIIPEPTTTPTNAAVPKNSEKIFLLKAVIL